MKKLILAVLMVTALVSCGKKNSDKNDGKANLTAAGATFPLPFYNMTIDVYTKNAVNTITYGGIGSGGGIRSLKDKVVDFGATDAYLSDDQASELPAEVVHIPTCIGAVVVAYNLDGVDGVKLTNKNLEDIFLGKVTKWNDVSIQSSNDGLSLPDKAITVVYRSDGSGTTYIFSDFMSKISEAWANSLGTGKALNWPSGIGAKGNPGVAGTISQTDGSIVYMGSEYAFAQKIQVAKLQNSSGKFIEPSIESISAAAKGEIPDDTRVMITNSADSSAYPISGFTWIILYKEQAYNGRSLSQAESTLDFLSWLIGPDAQAIAPQVHYSPLPNTAIEKAKSVLASVTYEGKPILK